MKRTQFDLMHPIFDAFRKFSPQELSATQRMLLLGLFKFMDGNGSCYPSYSTITEVTGLSKNAIRLNIKKLVEGGWITYQKGNETTSNRYQLNLKKIGIVAGEQKKSNGEPEIKETKETPKPQKKRSNAKLSPSERFRQDLIKQGKKPTF